MSSADICDHRLGEIFGLTLFMALEARSLFMGVAAAFPFITPTPKENAISLSPVGSWYCAG